MVRLSTNIIGRLFINEHCWLFVYQQNTIGCLFINEHYWLLLHQRTLLAVCSSTSTFGCLFINKHYYYWLFVHQRILLAVSTLNETFNSSAAQRQHLASGQRSNRHIRLLVSPSCRTVLHYIHPRRERETMTPVCQLNIRPNTSA